MRPAVGGRPLAPLPLVDRFHGDPGLVRRVRWFCDDGGRDQVVAGFVRLVLFGDARDGGFDRFPETGLRLRAVAVPVGAPDPVQVPAEAVEDLLPQPVAVAGDLARSGTSRRRTRCPARSGRVLGVATPRSIR